MHMASRPEQQIPIADAWALTAMADRINDGRYVKFVEYATDETGHATDVIAYRPNRELIRDSIEKGDPAVTDADRQMGVRMADHFQGLMFTVLGGGSHEFDEKIFKLIQQDTIGANTGMAFLACMGNRYHKELTRERVAESTTRIGTSSQYQGQVGGKIRCRVSILSKFAGRTFDGSVIRATDGANLYFWTSSQLVAHWPESEEFEITGTVKTHSTDQNGHRETRLTRVKIAM